MLKKTPSARPSRVLLADDDAVTRKMFEHHLGQAGFAVTAVADGLAWKDRLTADFELALVDLQMPGCDGLECLRFARERFPDIPVLMISQVTELKSAVRAIKEGAFDYVSKPVDADQLLAHIEQALRAKRLVAENRELRELVGSPMPTTDVVAESPKSKKLLEQVERVASIDATVLLTGESGTGKTTWARHLHRLGPRANKPFVSISCASLPRDLIEAELFGHTKGAFTGAIGDRPGRAELADGGTLFLDEIGDMPLDLQPKLLTFLQDRVVQRIGGTESHVVDVRLVAATNQDLEEKVRDGSFRSDLYFRLNVISLHVPTLRERAEDILAIAHKCLSRIASKRGVAGWSLSAEGARELVRYSWPGNIRELENVLERSTAFATSSEIGPDDLGLKLSPALETNSQKRDYSLAGRTLEDIERQAIIDALSASGGNKRAAARSLGIDEKSIYNKMRRLEIQESEVKGDA